MADFVQPAKVNIFWKKRDESFDSLKLGTVLQSPEEDQDPGLDGIQNIGFLPPIAINDSLLVDIFYQSESKAGKKRKIEWLDTRLTKNINQTGGIDDTVEEVTIDSVDGIEVNDHLKIEEEVVQISQITGLLIRIHRGEHGTAAMAHPNGTKITLIECSVPLNSIILDGRADPLPIPTGVTAVGARKIITVRWDPYTGINQKLLKHFNVWRSEFADPVVATLRDRSDTTIYVDNIPEGDAWEYWYWISAVDTSGNETGKSTDIAFASAIIDTAPPEMPTTPGINLNAVANGMKLLFGVIATGQTQTIDEARLRVKKAYDYDVGADTLDLRTVAEGGAGPDSDLLQFDTIYGSAYGARHTITVEIPGRYFYTWALHNSLGWSGWTDGHTLVEGPSTVPIAHSINTKNIVDTGPPQTWSVVTIPGETINTVRVKATKPEINGKTLLYWSVQIKNSGVGAWRAIDENAGAAETYYDGSAISHTIDDGSTYIKRDTGVGFGTAKIGDLILLDVRGGQFHRNYCQWGAIHGFETGLASTSTYIRLKGGFRPQAYTDIRIKVVKMPHTWNTEGYLGDLPGFGQEWDFIPNIDADEYVSKPIPIDVDIDSIDARVWFENTYSRSDASNPTSTPTFSTDFVKVKSRRDNVLPSKPLLFSVTTLLGEFIGVWNDPAEGYSTLDDAIVQFALDATFTTGVETAYGLGHVNRATGYRPGATFWFRVCVHNTSGLASHASTIAVAGPTGWGPWSDIFGPITSAPDTGAPADTVIPGQITTLSVAVDGPTFIATWSDPLTGNLTIDDHMIQYAENAGMTLNLKLATGLGNVHRQPGYDPGKTYWFQVVAHNQSGLTSAPGMSGYGTGWGPWSPAVGPITSTGVPGAPVDTALPTVVQLLTATGGNGKFVVKWSDPAIGYRTIDDVAIAWSTTPAGAPVDQIAKGWGRRNVLESEKPNCSFYFWVAAHNQSGLTSDGSTYSVLGTTGWGPWTGPTALTSSGTLPGAGATSENLVPNGSFELDSDGDGIPDDHTCPWNGSLHVGTGRVGGGIHGSFNFRITTGASCSIALGGFAVYPGERLSFSARMSPDGFAGAVYPSGFYFRLNFADANQVRNFTPGAGPAISGIDICSGINPPGGWVKYESQITVPASAAWCRIEFYNYNFTGVTFYIDDVVVTRTSTNNDIGPGAVAPGNVTGELRTEYVETFETPLSPDWSYAPAGRLYRSPGTGLDGSYSLRYDGFCDVYHHVFLPFDPTKLYRMTIRIMPIAIYPPATGALHIGVTCYDANKTNIGTVRVNYNGFAIYGGMSPDTWYNSTGWFKGHGGSAWTGPAPDPQAPLGLPNATRYIGPNIMIGYPSDATGVGNFVHVDDIRIETLDEAVYTDAQPNGTFGTKYVYVLSPFAYATTGEAASAYVQVAWDYTDGTVKAQQFAVNINDGTAAWTAYVPARAGAGVLRHALYIYKVGIGRTMTISVQAEAIRPGGNVAGPSTAFTPFGTGANSGSAIGGLAGYAEIDWAHGNIWYDSVQYRNNIAPSNGVTTISAANIQFPQTGSGSNHAKIIAGLNSYSQGPWIATHLAIYLHLGTSSLVLNGDMVVAYLPIGGLPSEYEIPISLANNGAFRVGVVAVAMTRNGPQHNGTYASNSKSSEGITFLTTSPNPRTIQIGSPSVSGDDITIHRRLRFYEGSVYGGALSANTGYLVYDSSTAGSGGTSWMMSPKGSFGMAMAPDSGMYNGWYMANYSGSSAAPSGGALIYINGGIARHLSTVSGSKTFAFAEDIAANYATIGHVHALTLQQFIRDAKGPDREALKELIREILREEAKGD